MFKTKIKYYWSKLSSDPRTTKIAGYAKKIAVAAILLIIIYQLYKIGWRDVLQSLPVQPVYYVIFVFLYISLPTAEVLIYKRLWTFRAWDGFKTFIKKKVYNHEVMGYTGEFYLFVWGRKLAGESEKNVLKNIRDSSIISAVTSNLVAVILVSTLIFTGQVEVLDLIGNVNWVYVGTGIFVIVVIGFILVQFRKYIFDLPLPKALAIFSIYLARFLVHHGLLVLSWAVVIPDTPISVWFTFLATVIIVNRIPFIPSKDLIFVWFGIELSRMLDMATASVAGMLLVYSVLTKVANLVLFSLISFYADPEDKEQIDADTPTLPFADPESESDQK